MQTEVIMKKWIMLIVLPVLLWIFSGLDMASCSEKGVQLGVYLQELNQEIRDRIQYDGKGVYVTQAIPGTAAHRAQIRGGDIIVAFQGKTVSEVQELVDAIQETNPGDEVEILFLSKGLLKTAKLAMGKTENALGTGPEVYAWKKDQDSEPQEKWMYFFGGERPWIGIGMLDLTDQLAGYFGVSQGVLVSEVFEDSPASRAGMQAGDVILSWNGQAVKNSGQLQEFLSASEAGQEVKIELSRNRAPQETALTLGEHKADTPEVYHYRFQQDSPDSVYQLFRHPQRGFVQPELPRVPPVPRFEVNPDEEGGLRKEMEDYRREMKNLREELKELRDQLQSLKEPMEH